MQTQIRQTSSYSTEDEKKKAVLKYSLQTLPGMSWGRIAGVLWFLDEHTALETVKQQLSHRPGKINMQILHVENLITVPVDSLCTVHTESRYEYVIHPEENT